MELLIANASVESSPKWIEWIKSFISDGSVAINVNDEIGPFFQTKKELRQGDPLSPILFNIVADMLTLLITEPKPMIRYREWCHT